MKYLCVYAGSGLEVSKDWCGKRGQDPSLCYRSRLKLRGKGREDIMKKEKGIQEEGAMALPLYPPRLPPHRPMRKQADSQLDPEDSDPALIECKTAFFESD